MYALYCEARRLTRRVERRLNPRQIRQARQTETFRAIRGRFYRNLWNQTAATIGAQTEDVGYGYLRISRGKTSTFVKSGEVMLDDHLTYMMAGNKPLIIKLLQSRDVPMPRFCEYTPKTFDAALAFLMSADGPVVVKPAAGAAAGHGVTTGISNVQELRRATVLASMISTPMLVEDEVEGDSYRLLYLNGIFLDAVRRGRPVVVGDGQHSIRELIQMENERRIRGSDITSLHPLTLDLDLNLRLRHDGRSLSQVVRDGEQVVVKNVCNQNSSSEQHVVREEVHPTTLQLAEGIVRELGIELVGIDIHCRDIAEPLSTNG